MGVEFFVSGRLKNFCREDSLTAAREDAGDCALCFRDEICFISQLKIEEHGSQIFQ